LEDFMGLSNALSLSASPRLKPAAVTAGLPQSFQEALKLGWSIVREESTINISNCQRNGVVLLRLKGAPVQLRIPYSATAKAWKFETPEAITAE
jgi:hypothetical protein